jgi:hypothetical protein
MTTPAPLLRFDISKIVTDDFYYKTVPFGLITHLTVGGGHPRMVVQPFASPVLPLEIDVWPGDLTPNQFFVVTESGLTDLYTLIIAHEPAQKPAQNPEPTRRFSPGMWFYVDRAAAHAKHPKVHPPVCGFLFTSGRFNPVFLHITTAPALDAEIHVLNIHGGHVGRYTAMTLKPGTLFVIEDNTCDVDFSRPERYMFVDLATLITSVVPA